MWPPPGPQTAMEIARSPLRLRGLRSLGVLLIAVIGYVFPIPLPAQDQSQEAIHVDVNLVMIDTTVKNKSGQIMADLKKNDFEVREDGAAQKLTVFSRDAFPLHVALVLDLSDSIGPFLGPLRDAASTALAALKSEDEVALFTFSNEAQLSAPFTKDKAKIAEQINTFHTGGATNINDGIFDAAKYFLETMPQGRRVVLLISDDVGTDAGGEGTRVRLFGQERLFHSLISLLRFKPGLLHLVPRMLPQAFQQALPQPAQASVQRIAALEKWQDR